MKLHSVKIELFTAKFSDADGRSGYGGAGVMKTPLLVIVRLLHGRAERAGHRDHVPLAVPVKRGTPAEVCLIDIREAMCERLGLNSAAAEHRRLAREMIVDLIAVGDTGEDSS